jgi:hypothetical protein
LKSWIRLAVLTGLLLLVSSLCYTSSTKAIGVANIVVTNVYWGSNPQMPETAHPGDINVQLSIVLSNVGDDVARGVTATLQLDFPLIYTYYSDDAEHVGKSISKTAGDIMAGSSFVLSFTLSIDAEAKEGIYQYNIQLSYKSARELQQINKTITVDAPIWWGDLRVQSVTTIPTKIYPGSKQVVVSVAIANSGRGIASNLQLRLDLKPPFMASSSGSDRLFLGNLPSGQVSQAQFVVDVQDDAPPAQYSVNLIEERDTKLVPVGEVPLYVNEKVNFLIASVTPSDVKAGETGVVIQVALQNAGTVKADSVRVQLRVGNFFSGTLTDFLGTMLAGETKTAYFTVDIDSAAQIKEYNLDLRIDWTQENNALDDTLILPLNVQSPGFPVGIFAGIAVIVVAAAGYFMYRRRKMMKSLPKQK